MNEFSVIAAEEDAGVRIDKFLSEQFPDLTRTYIQKLILSENITVNQNKCKSNYKISNGDCINLNVPEPIQYEITSENIPLDILFEDDDILVVNKPKGMVVHPAVGHNNGTLVNALMYHCGDNLSGINGVLRPGIVHRIDKDTTGSLIVCKNDISHNEIAKQLKEHSINRKYIAIVHGNFKETTGTINAPIGRHNTDRKKMAVNYYKNGKNAVTHYTVLEQYKNFSLIECVLETGRTHQIRVHMSSINHPLLGDSVYSNIQSKFNLQGQVLHAEIIGFVHPRTGEYIEIKAPIPEYFNKLIDILRNS